MRDELSLGDAQQKIVVFITEMRGGTGETVAGERPDDAGEYSAGRGVAKDKVDRLGELLRHKLLVASADKLKGQFSGTTGEAAVNAFLRELSGEFSLLPPEVFGPISVFVGKTFDVAWEQPDEDQRRFEINVRYLLAASALDEPEIRRELAECIATHKAKHGGRITLEEEDAIVDALADPEKLRVLREAS